MKYLKRDEVLALLANERESLWGCSLDKARPLIELIIQLECDMRKLDTYEKED